MSFQKSTTMSVKRILISLGIFLLIPIVRYLLSRVTGSDTLSFMFALNLAVWLLVLYDWELFGLHWNRAKAVPADTLIYSAVGFIAMFFWTFLNSKYLGGYLVLPDPSVFHTDPIAGPAVRFAFSFSLGTIISIEFKCLTDHMKIHAREATIYTLLFTPFRLSLLIPTYLYNIILFSLMSYLYNQTHSIIPGILSFTAVYLCWMIFFVS